MDGLREEMDIPRERLVTKAMPFGPLFHSMHMPESTKCALTVDFAQRKACCQPSRSTRQKARWMGSIGVLAWGKLFHEVQKLH